MHSEYIVNIAQLWLRAGNYVEEIKYLIHGYQNQNDFKGWILMTLISADRAHNVSLNRNQDAVFIPEKLLALTPAECISDLNKLLKETKDEGGKFWQKSLHVKAALLAGIAVLEKEAKGANFVSNAITEKENPRIFKHLNNSPRESLLETSKRKTQNLNDAIDRKSVV